MGRFEAIHGLLCDLAGRELAVDDDVWRSEMDTAHRNLAIAHLLRSHDIITDSPEDVVSAYARQCSVLVTAEDLAMMAATLANSRRAAGDRQAGLRRRPGAPPPVCDAHLRHVRLGR